MSLFTQGVDLTGVPLFNYSSPADDILNIIENALSNYYNKGEIDFKLSTKLDSSIFDNYKIIVDNSINLLDLNKLNITTFDASWNSLANIFVSKTGDTMNGNYNIIGDLFIDGSLNIMGGATTIETETITIKDNIIQINSNQTGTPPPTLQSGIEVERGDLTNYQFLFDENLTTFKIGQIGSLQPVATREETPNNNRIPYWDVNETRFKTDRFLTIDDSNNISIGSTPLNPYRLDIRNLTNNDTRVMINDCSQCTTNSNASLNIFIRENQTKEHIHLRRAFTTPNGIQVKDFGLSIDEDNGLTLGKYNNNGNYEQLLYINENHTIEVDGEENGDFIITGTPNISLKNIYNDYLSKSQGGIVEGNLFLDFVYNGTFVNSEKFGLGSNFNIQAQPQTDPTYYLSRSHSIVREADRDYITGTNTKATTHEIRFGYADTFQNSPSGFHPTNHAMKFMINSGTTFNVKQPLTLLPENVGIHNNTPQYPLDVIGSINASNYLQNGVFFSNIFAPISHTHPISQITNLQTELNNKSNIGHTHTTAEIISGTFLDARIPSLAISKITNLQTELNNKSNIGHTHVIGDITNLQTELNNKSNIGHTHVIGDITNLQTELNGKLNLTGGDINGDLNVSGNVGIGKTPSEKLDVNGTARATAFNENGTLLSNKYAPISHTHQISEIVNLQTSLNNKSNIGHTHEISDITNLSASLQSRPQSTYSNVFSFITNNNYQIDIPLTNQPTQFINYIIETKFIQQATNSSARGEIISTYRLTEYETSQNMFLIDTKRIGTGRIFGHFISTSTTAGTIRFTINPEDGFQQNANCRFYVDIYSNAGIGNVGTPVETNLGTNTALTENTFDSNYIINLGGNTLFTYRHTVVLSSLSSDNFYPVVLVGDTGNELMDTFYFDIQKSSRQSGGALYNNERIHGWANGRTWHDDANRGYYDINVGRFDDNERSCLGLYTGNQNFAGICFYLRGGTGGNYRITTNSRNILVGTTSAVITVQTSPSTFAIKDATGADIIGTSAQITQELNVLNLSGGRYTRNTTNINGDLNVSGVSSLGVRGEVLYNSGVAGDRLSIGTGVNKMAIRQNGHSMEFTTTNNGHINLLPNGTGNVGIGTINPTKSYLNQDLTGNRMLSILGGVSGNTGGLSRLNLGGDNAHYASIIGQHSSFGKTSLQFLTASSATIPSEKMRITSEGDVGIGNTAPSAKLDVGGDTRVSGTLSVAQASFLETCEISRRTVNDSTWAQLGHSVSYALNTKSTGYGLLMGNTGQTLLNSSGGNSIEFRHNNSTNMTILSGGNVGIGTNDPVSTLHVVLPTNVNAGWRNFIVRGTSYWGDGIATFDPTKVLTDGILYGTVEPIMFRNPHIVSNNGGTAGIRFGRAGGVSTGAWWEAGVATNGNFHILREAGSIGININTSGNVGIGVNNPLGSLDIDQAYHRTIRVSNAVSATANIIVIPNTTRRYNAVIRYSWDNNGTLYHGWGFVSIRKVFNNNHTMIQNWAYNGLTNSVSSNETISATTTSTYNLRFDAFISTLTITALIQYV